MMERRDFLKLCGSGFLYGLLSPLSSGMGMAATPGAIHPGPDWKALAEQLHGDLIRPGNARYPSACRLFDPRYDAVHPGGMAYCASPADVQASLAFSREHKLPFAVRAGGHSFEGYSTAKGLVIDVTRMKAVQVNTAKRTATIGAGARLIDVYKALAAHGLALPAGSCPTVGIAGLTLGGGHGVLGRKFGLTCDNLLAANVVTADGRHIACDAEQHSDLFWALRGGGGGNFGIVTGFTFQVHPVGSLCHFTFDWPRSQAVAVIDAWQHWAPTAPAELWSNCILGGVDRQGHPSIRINGVYVGSMQALQRLLAKFLADAKVAPSRRIIKTSSLLATMMLEAGCADKTLEACHLPGQTPTGRLQRETSSTASDYFAKPLPRPAIQHLVEAVSGRAHGGITLDAYGGAINDIPKEATAFVHRDALFSAQYSAHWQVGAPVEAVSARLGWLRHAKQTMKPYATGGAYQNYVDGGLDDWPKAYYGENLARLQQIKATVDPTNVFQFAQSIRPA